MSSLKYDKKLMQEDPLFALHKFALPHIGKDYDTFRILHVGESNYLGQDPKRKTDKYGIPFFAEKWWNTEYSIEDLMRRDPDTHWDGDWTRNVIKEFESGISDFFDLYAAMGKALLKLEFPNIECTEKNIREYYGRYFAFTDYYKMPSLYTGSNIVTSLSLARKKLTEEEKSKYPARSFNRENKRQAEMALDAVIKVLEPKIIIVTSTKAMNDYKGKYKDKMMHIYHPSSKRYGYFRQEELEEKLEKALREYKN